MLHKQRLLTPGPTPLPESVRLAMAKDMIHHRKDAFKQTLAKVQSGCQTLFGTTNPVIPLSCSGTGAMVAAVGNLFSPGDKVLVVEGGKFGQRWSQIARQRGLDVTPLEVEWGQPVDPALVDAELKKYSYAGLLVQASETSTGVLHPIRQLGGITRDAGVLLVADGISAVGVSPCPMDDWHVDCLITGSQKGLMLPPGLALIACSDRAWQRMESVECETFYFDLKAERASAERFQTRFTSPVGLLVGLEEALHVLLADGLDGVFRKQWALTSMARAGVTAMGLEPLVNSSFTWGLTSVNLPAGVDGAAVLSHMQRQNGVIMAGGQDHLKGRIVRLGHMGWVDFGDIAAGLHVLADALNSLGGLQNAAPDYLEQALAAYHQGLNEPLPKL